MGWELLLRVFCGEWKQEKSPTPFILRAYLHRNTDKNISQYRHSIPEQRQFYSRKLSSRDKTGGIPEVGCVQL